MSIDGKAAVARLDGGDVTLQALLHAMKLSDRLDGFGHALDDLLIQRAASREGIRPTDAELQAEADSLRVALGLMEAAATHAWLAARGLSVEEFESYVERIVAARSLRARLTGDRIEAYFLEHRPAFDAARIARLAFADADQAQAAMKSLASGESTFGALAAVHAADAAAAPADGAGFVLRMHMDPEVAVAVFRATPGQIVGPVQTTAGLNEVVRVEEVRRAELDARTAGLVGDLLFSHWLQGERQRSGTELLLPKLVTPV